MTLPEDFSLNHPYFVPSLPLLPLDSICQRIFLPAFTPL